MKKTKTEDDLNTENRHKKRGGRGENTGIAVFNYSN